MIFSLKHVSMWSRLHVLTSPCSHDSSSRISIRTTERKNGSLKLCSLYSFLYFFFTSDLSVRGILLRYSSVPFLTRFESLHIRRTRAITLEEIGLLRTDLIPIPLTRRLRATIAEEISPLRTDLNLIPLTRRPRVATSKEIGPLKIDLIPTQLLGSVRS